MKNDIANISYSFYKSVRAASGMTQEQAAKYFGVSRAYLSRWDCGLSKIPAKHNKKIMELNYYVDECGIAAWERKNIKRIIDWYNGLGEAAKKELRIQLDSTIT